MSKETIKKRTTKNAKLESRCDVVFKKTMTLIADSESLKLSDAIRQACEQWVSARHIESLSDVYDITQKAKEGFKYCKYCESEVPEAAYRIKDGRCRNCEAVRQANRPPRKR